MEMPNDNVRIKAVVLVSVFVLSMVVVGTIAYKMGAKAEYERGYNDGYAAAEEYWIDLINTNLGPLIDAVYLEGYAYGFQDGYLWGWVDAWNTYGNGDDFRYPIGGGGVVP